MRADAEAGAAVWTGTRPLAFSLGRGRQLLLAYLIALVPALGMAFAQPVWQLTDEAQQYDVVAQYAHGVYPVEGKTTLQPETVDVMRLTGVYRWSPADTQPLPEQGDARTFTPPPSYLNGYAYQLWVRRHIWWFSYEAMQPPLFYAIAAPVWAISDHLGGALAAVYALRVLNALLLCLLAPLTLLTGWLLTRRDDVSIAATIAVIALPGLALNGSQVTNDTLGAVLGTATALVALLVAGRPQARWAALLGVALGATLLAKLTAAGLAGGVALALAWLALSGISTWLRQLGLVSLAGAACALVLSPWLLLNLHTFGHLVPSAEAANLMGAATSGATYTFAQSLMYCFVTFWTGEHMNTVPLTGAMALGSLAFAMLGIVGVQRLLRGTGRISAAAGSLAILSATVGGQIAWALVIPLVSGVGGMTPGRYLYPAVVPALLLLTAGIWALFKPELSRMALAAIVVLGVLNLGLYAQGYTAWYQEPRYDPLTATMSQDINLAGSYSGVEIDVDRLLVDHTQHTIWLHLIVKNHRSDNADWWSEPLVTFPNGHHVWAS